MEQQRDDEQAVPMPPTPITVIHDDVLADVFRRVAATSPRRLAACRCVCRAWRALIDDRRLLRADLLPLSLAGLLLCLNVEPERPELFVRPGANVTGHLMPRRTIGMADHCNGLVLVNDDVLNPATGRVARLPECLPSPLWQKRCFGQDSYLAYDPAESPYHYQVFCIPMVLTLPVYKAELAVYRAIAGSEWPPSPFVLSVFSSATGRWEARPLVRRGGAAGTVDDMKVPPTSEHQHSACWRGALYVHCQNDFVLRIPLLSDDGHTTTTTTYYYQVIKPPREVEECRLCRGGHGGRLGRSEKGVYFASFDREFHLCVWILIHDDDECGGRMEWVLMRHRSAYGLAQPSSSPRSSSWTLHNAFRSEDGDADAQEWDSDDDDDEGESTLLYTETGDGIRKRLVDFDILAFHPYREIVFMNAPRARGAAYHLKSSKLEDLGNLIPKDATPTPGLNWMENAFPYTPCRMGAP